MYLKIQMQAAMWKRSGGFKIGREHRQVGWGIPQVRLEPVINRTQLRDRLGFGSAKAKVEFITRLQSLLHAERNASSSHFLNVSALNSRAYLLGR